MLPENGRTQVAQDICRQTHRPPSHEAPGRHLQVQSTHRTGSRGTHPVLAILGLDLRKYICTGMETTKYAIQCC